MGGGGIYIDFLRMRQFWSPRIQKQWYLSVVCQCVLNCSAKARTSFNQIWYIGMFRPYLGTIHLSFVNFDTIQKKLINTILILFYSSLIYRLPYFQKCRFLSYWQKKIGRGAVIKERIHLQKLDFDILIRWITFSIPRICEELKTYKMIH